MPICQAKPSDARGIAEVNVASWRSAYREILTEPSALSPVHCSGVKNSRQSDTLSHSLCFQRPEHFLSVLSKRDAASRTKAVRLALKQNLVT